MRIRRYVKWPMVIPVGLAAFAVFVFIGGEIVKALWNWLLPPLFGWPAITFWQGLGLLALSRILFGGFGGRGGRSHRMSQEDRERVRQRMRERFCGPSGESRPDPEVGNTL